MSSAATSRALSSSNASIGKKTSPRISTSAGIRSPFSRCGISAIVRTLGVMSSPVRPSPRVAARVSSPCSYVRLTARPSTLSSHRKWWTAGADVLGDALGPDRQPLVVEGVVQGEHPLAVLDRGELRPVRPGDLLGRRLGRTQLRVLVLQVLQRAHQPVELGVADDRLVVHVVPEAVLLDLLRKERMPLLRLRGHFRFLSMRPSSRPPVTRYPLTQGCLRAISRPGRSGRARRAHTRATHLRARTTE